jgi:hypothetical protein
MKFIIASISIFLMLPCASRAQSGCAVNFAPATSKPSVLQSILTTISSFNPKGENQRLSDLRQVVIDLRNNKSTLLDTLSKVKENDSVPAWLQARVQQIPEMEKQIVTLFWKMHAEGDKGRLFAGDKSFAELSVVVDQKTKQLDHLCILASTSLPLGPQDKRDLDNILVGLRSEVETLGKIDDEIGKLIQKANDQTNNSKKTG